MTAYANRGALSGGSSSPTLASTVTAESTHRFAEDSDVLLAEVNRWLDSIDCVVMSAQSGVREYTRAEALEFVLVGHGRIRRFLADAVVAA